ncbi:MAG: ABC transporter permease, partial [Eubacteriales bacterium]
LLMSFALMALFGVIAVSLIKDHALSEENQKIYIGVVGDTKNSYLGFGISSFAELDATKNAVGFIEFESESDAKKALESGNIAAYALIPDDFIKDIVNGDVRRIEYVTTDNAGSLASLFNEEMLGMITRILVETQNGIYALQSAMEDNSLPNVFSTADKLNMEYFKLILNRQNMSSQSYLGVSDSLSLGGYMICALMILFLMMSGISACALFDKRDNSLSRLLCSKGCGAMRQVTEEYACYFILMLINTAVVFIFICFAAGDMVSSLKEFENFGISKALFFFVRLLPVLLMSTSLQFMIYELSDGIIGGVLAQLVLSLSLCYASGCFYPINFFPDSIQKISSFLPTGIARGFLTGSLSGNTRISSAIFLVIYAVAFIAVSVFLRERRIKSR